MSVPLVTLHTTGDEVVPYWHATRYRDKVAGANSSLFHEHIEVDGHGHCAFGFSDISTAFNTMVAMVHNPPRHICYLPAVFRAP